MIGINYVGKRYERLANQMFQYAAVKGIAKNREYSIKHREEILEYAQTFDWINVVRDYYIPNVEKVLAS